MTLLEKINRYLTINQTLNKDLFDDSDYLYSEVHNQLLLISQEFIKFLKIDIEPKDIIITGSNAGYTYTPDSDIDIHIIIDFSELKGDSTLIKEFFLAKKGIWNDKRDISVKGYPIEIYIQDKIEELVSSGVYSILYDDWVNKPELKELKKADIDWKLVDKKVEQFRYDIDKAIDDSNIEKLTRIKSKIKKLRKSGLHSKGEFSVENLTFKSLRNNGTIKKLMDWINNLYDKQLSLEQVQNEGKISDLLKPVSDKEYESFVSPLMCKINKTLNEITIHLINKGYKYYERIGPYPERYKKGDYSIRVFKYDLPIVSVNGLVYSTGKIDNIIDRMELTDKNIEQFKNKVIRCIDNMGIMNESKNNN